jgi:hypothetical protein
MVEDGNGMALLGREFLILELKAFKVLKDFRVLKVFKALEHKVQPVLRVRQEHKEFKVLRVQMEL